jgi:hypothetical protein
MSADQKVVDIGALRSLGEAIVNGYRKRVYHMAGTSRSITSSADPDQPPICANVSDLLTDRLGAFRARGYVDQQLPSGDSGVNTDGLAQPVQENASANKSHCLPVTFPMLSKKLALGD